MSDTPSNRSDMHFATHCAEETITAGRAIGVSLQIAAADGLLLILSGDLGAGKTTLVKGIAEALGAADPEEVTSPTFTLVHEYPGAEVKLYHLDLYRLEEERQLVALGIDEMIAPGNIVLIEWGEKFPSLVARAHGEILLMHRGPDQREIRARWHKQVVSASKLA